MNKIDNQESGQEKTVRSSHRRLVVFIVCVLMSTFMWLFIELMKDYNDELKYTLQFENVPKDLILTKSGNSTILVGINAQGFELLTAKYFNKNRSITVDLSKVNIRQTKDGYSAYISTEKLINEFKKQINISKNIISIKPDTLFFKFSEVYRKQVKVVPSLKYTFNSQYDLVDSIEIIPRTITVSSIKSIIDTLKFVTTIPANISNIDTNLTLRLPLNKSFGGKLINYSTDTIIVKFKVNQVTEAVYSVPVNSFAEGKNIKIFPDKVQVFCRVPMKDYNLVEASSFIAQVNYVPGADKKLKVQLVRVPDHVKVLRIEPASIDYILISK